MNTANGIISIIEHKIIPDLATSLYFDDIPKIPLIMPTKHKRTQNIYNTAVELNATDIRKVGIGRTPMINEEMANHLDLFFPNFEPQ
jgi:hypothetical protein